MRFLVLAAALSLAGCRLEAPAETPDEELVETPAGGTAAGDGVGAPPQAPPVGAGDTARGTPSHAGTFDPSAGLRPTVSATGLAIPVVGVGADDLVDTFEEARSEGRAHDAIDIPAPRGTPVVAAAAGEVARLFESDRGGLTVYVLGADRRLVYYYAHLDAYAPGLAAGQRVRRGQPLGTVGDSGNAVPGDTHLHFAVWRTADPADVWDGEPVNPYPLLAR